MEKGTFAAGCFWKPEAVFRKLAGVTEVCVGYIGGTLDNPTYEDVCYRDSGHAEAVEIEFDPDQVSYEELLEVVWSCHDPTTLNRQGPDVGTQYRSAVFFHSAEQEAAAVESKAKLEAAGRYRDPIVTEILPAPTFYRAEEYHQHYFEKHGLT